MGEQPARLFWSVTIYDNRARSMIDTDQQRAGLSTYSDLKKNADGSSDLYFAPDAPAGMETNWMKTIASEGFFAMFRIYGPLEPVFDGTWKLGDIKRRCPHHPVLGPAVAGHRQCRRQLRQTVPVRQC
jgi:hypothetical protein